MSKITSKTIVNFAKSLGLECYNIKQDHLCIKGVNGHATLVYVGFDYKLDIAKHLRQMGRDSLKMDLENLLNITKHN